MCKSAGSMGGFRFFATRYQLPEVQFFSHCLCGIIIIIMPGYGCYGLALVKPKSDLEGFLYKCVLLTEWTPYL